MFEPGLWCRASLSAEPTQTLPTLIPTPDRSVFTTPYGLLMNELLKCPNAIGSSLVAITNLALELDAGRYVEPTGDVLLYITRLLVRVEGHVQIAIVEHARARDADTNIALELKELSTQIKRLLGLEVVPVLQRWCDRATRGADVRCACTLHAHMLFSFHNLESSGDFPPSKRVQIFLLSLSVSEKPFCV